MVTRPQIGVCSIVLIVLNAYSMAFVVSPAPRTLVSSNLKVLGISLPETIKETTRSIQPVYNDAPPLTQAFEAHSAPIVLFDGVCNFCNSGMWFVMGHSDPNRLRFAAQQSAAGQQLLLACNMDPEAMESIFVLDKSGELHSNSDACIQIGKGMKFPFPLLATIAALIPFRAREAAYKWVSKQRSVFGESDSCRLPEDDEVLRFYTTDEF